jgi:hypothetical protein
MILTGSSEMSSPWIDIKQYQDQENLDQPGSPEYTWQAIFAYQAGIRPHPDWAKMKWGFNAQALFDEALERQRLFLISQYSIQNEWGTESPDQRTLALRFVSRPGEDLLVAIIAKVHARNEAEAIQQAMAYHRELSSTFPYDYTLKAADRDAYKRVTGNDILENAENLHIAQIRRMELPLRPATRLPMLQGVWQSGPRAHEQIWRFLATLPQPTILNMSMRSSVLSERERLLILENAHRIDNFRDDSMDHSTLSALKEWSNKYKERRTHPWKKFFQVQVQLASWGNIDENAFRVLGTSLTLSPDGQSSPGYRALQPTDHERAVWQKKLENLDFIRGHSSLTVPRLSEIADMEEVFSVMRLPYSPPENGFPDLRFADISD